MPTPLPSSFASAAAGNVHDPNKRGDGTTGGEWYAVFLCSVIILVTGVLFFAFPFFLMALADHSAAAGVLANPCCMVLTELFLFFSFLFACHHFDCLKLIILL